MLTAIVAQVAPGSRLVGSTTFAGGISSEMTLVEVERDDGTRRRFVVRRSRGERVSMPIGVEFRLLESLWARRLPVPEPLFLDESSAISELPYMVLGYVEGAPRIGDDGGTGTARQLADLLVSIHQVDGSLPELDALPRRTDQVARVLEHPRTGLDDSIREGRILDVLRTHWPPALPPRPTLLHCDLWLGNVVWAGGEVAAVIDWENAAVGDPLADLAITRLECAWSFGRDAVSVLTERYVERTGIDTALLPRWDLWAARRPAAAVSAWAADWANYGRPDMTSARMRAAHRWFVDDALAALGEAD